MNHSRAPRRRLCWQEDQVRLTSPAAGGWCATSPILGRCVAAGQPRYGARNAVSAASHLLGSLLGDPVGAAGNDQGLHVVGGQLHRVRDPLADAFRSADGQDGQGQPPFRALLVLRDGGIERAVDREAGVQGVGIGGERVM